MCWVALSQDVHKRLQKKVPESSSGSRCSDEVTWNRDGSVAWFWNLADCNRYLPLDLGSFEVFGCWMTTTEREQPSRPEGGCWHCQGNTDGWGAGKDSHIPQIRLPSLSGHLHPELLDSILNTHADSSHFLPGLQIDVICEGALRLVSTRAIWCWEVVMNSLEKYNGELRKHQFRSSEPKSSLLQIPEYLCFYLFLVLFSHCFGLRSDQWVRQPALPFDDVAGASYRWTR